MAKKKKRLRNLEDLHSMGEDDAFQDVPVVPTTPAPEPVNPVNPVNPPSAPSAPSRPGLSLADLRTQALRTRTDISHQIAELEAWADEIAATLAFLRAYRK